MSIYTAVIPAIPVLEYPVPSIDPMKLETMILIGETYTVIGEESGWLKVQLMDGNEGFISLEHHSYGDIKARSDPSHVISVARADVFDSLGQEKEVIERLPMNARVAPVKTINSPFGCMSYITGLGWVFEEQMCSLTVHGSDLAYEALKFLNMPYVWGDRGYIGIDCSGLVQAVLIRCGYSNPPKHRSADIAEAVGQLLFHYKKEPNAHPIRRNDIICFEGHVGIMASDVDIVHANTHSGCVTCEPLSVVIDRRRSQGKSGVTAIRRIHFD